eukprot:131981-Chlamydomonas_euryale.AAC.2
MRAFAARSAASASNSSSSSYDGGETLGTAIAQQGILFITQIHRHRDTTVRKRHHAPMKGLGDLHTDIVHAPARCLKAQAQYNFQTHHKDRRPWLQINWPRLQRSGWHVPWRDARAVVCSHRRARRGTGAMRLRRAVARLSRLHVTAQSTPVAQQAAQSSAAATPEPAEPGKTGLLSPQTTNDLGWMSGMRAQVRAAGTRNSGLGA